MSRRLFNSRNWRLVTAALGRQFSTSRSCDYFDRYRDEVFDRYRDEILVDYRNEILDNACHELFDRRSWDYFDRYRDEVDSEVLDEAWHELFDRSLWDDIVMNYEPQPKHGSCSMTIHIDEHDYSDVVDVLNEGVDVHMKEKKIWDVCGLASTRAGPSGGFYCLPSVSSASLGQILQHAGLSGSMSWSPDVSHAIAVTNPFIGSRCCSGPSSFYCNPANLVKSGCFDRNLANLFKSCMLPDMNNDTSMIQGVGVDVHMKENFWDICALASTRAGPSGGFYCLPSVSSSSLGQILQHAGASGNKFSMSWSPDVSHAITATDPFVGSRGMRSCLISMLENNDMPSRDCFHFFFLGYFLDCIITFNPKGGRWCLIQAIKNLAYSVIIPLKVVSEEGSSMQTMPLYNREAVSDGPPVEYRIINTERKPITI